MEIIDEQLAILRPVLATNLIHRFISWYQIKISSGFGAFPPKGVSANGS